MEWNSMLFGMYSTVELSSNSDVPCKQAAVLFVVDLGMILCLGFFN